MLVSGRWRLDPGAGETYRKPGRECGEAPAAGVSKDAPRRSETANASTTTSREVADMEAPEAPVLLFDVQGGGCSGTVPRLGATVMAQSVLRFLPAHPDDFLTVRL